ncbi:MAG: hypothetical protein RL021_1149, partial [Bacteroidota bacterium]
MRIGVFAFLLLSAFRVNGQDGEPFVRVTRQGLYEYPTDIAAQVNSDNKPFVVFSDDMGSEVWVSPEKKCITMGKVHAPVAEGTTAIHLTWDKVSGGCDWIGIGFGWEDWQPKDLSGSWRELALSLKVRAVTGTFSNFPVAFAFEDYSGVQTYCGFQLSQASGRFNDREWTTVRIPLTDFPFVRKDANLSKVKQLMIQLEGAGAVYLD